MNLEFQFAAQKLDGFKPSSLYRRFLALSTRARSS